MRADSCVYWCLLSKIRRGGTYHLPKVVGAGWAGYLTSKPYPPGLAGLSQLSEIFREIAFGRQALQLQASVLQQTAYGHEGSQIIVVLFCRYMSVITGACVLETKLPIRDTLRNSALRLSSEITSHYPAGPESPRATKASSFIVSAYQGMRSVTRGPSMTCTQQNTAYDTPSLHVQSVRRSIRS